MTLSSQPTPVSPKWQALAFATPTMGLAFLMGPMGVVQGIYARHFGMSLTVIAAVLLVSRVFDAITDPLIGHFSDRHRVRTGSRKPLVLLGGLCLIPCSYFLFVPPASVGAAYFMTWTLMFYLASTLLSIPTNAWGSELSSDSVQRTTLFTTMVFLGRIGGGLFYLVPFLPIFTTTEITPDTLKVSVLVGAVLIVSGLYCALRFVPNGPPPQAAPKPTTAQQQAKWHVFQDLIGTVKNNKPFQTFVAAYMFYGLGMGMCGGLLFIYIDAFLGEGAVFAQLSILSIVGGLLLIPLIYKVVIVLGKKTTWFLSMLIVLAALLYLGQLHPGENAYFGLIVFYVIFTVSGVTSGVIAMPMLSETIDYALLSDKTERRGVYFSVFSMMVKAEAALGMALGLAIAGWLGFDATATEHNAQATFAIHMAVSWVPVGLASVGLYFIWHYPLNERRSAIIHRRLSRRQQLQTLESARPVAETEPNKSVHYPYEKDAPNA